MKKYVVNHDGRREALRCAEKAAEKAAQDAVFSYCDVRAAVERAFATAADACGCECAAERVRAAEKAELEWLREDWDVGIFNAAKTEAFNRLWRVFAAEDRDIADSLARRIAGRAVAAAWQSAADEAAD